MYIDSIEINQLRCFETANLRLARPDNDIPNVTLLLGNNGSGKTTILKALALAVLGPVIKDSGFKPEYLIRRTGKLSAKTRRKGKLLASLNLHGQDVGGLKDFTHRVALAEASAKVVARGDYERIVANYTAADKGGVQTDGLDKGTVQSKHRALDVNRLFDDESSAYFIVGYGATRRVASPKSSNLLEDRRRGLRYQRVAGLFEDYVTLWPLKLWLPELRQKSAERHKEVIDLVNDLLPKDTSFSGEFDDLQPIFVHRGVELPFTALSDGYRGYIGLVADLLYHLQDACPKRRKLSDMSGVVLIDDVDLHLHPQWQRVVITKLCASLPRLQFVVTSHSPLVAGTLFAENIRTIESPPKGPSSVLEIDERIHGLNADQILTSAYFGLKSSRSPKEVAKLRELADNVERQGTTEASVAFLRELAGKDSE